MDNGLKITLLGCQEMYTGNFPTVFAEYCKRGERKQRGKEAKNCITHWRCKFHIQVMYEEKNSSFQSFSVSTTLNCNVECNV